MIFVLQKPKGVHRLMIHGRGYDDVAGPRLFKGATKSFPNGPPWHIAFTHTSMAEAYDAAELLQQYISESEEARREHRKK